MCQKNTDLFNSAGKSKTNQKEHSLNSSGVVDLDVPLFTLQSIKNISNISAQIPHC